MWSMVRLPIKTEVKWVLGVHIYIYMYTQYIITLDATGKCREVLACAG